MELAGLLAERGHDVHVVTATNIQSLPGLSIHTITCPAMLRSLKTATFVRRAGAFCREHGFDIVHAVSPMPDADVYQPRGGLLAETMARNVATRPTASRRLLKRALMAMNVKQRALLDLERRTFAEGGPVIACVSSYVAQQCANFYPAAKDRLRVIFNGVQVRDLSAEERAATRASLRGELGVGDDTLLLAFIAHNFRLKGLGPLIETISRLKTAGVDKVRLLVVGRDNVVPYLRRLKALGIENQVTFTGPSRRTSSLLVSADVCVHPTYYDPCSRVVLEALSLGVPVITTAFNGAAEVIRDGYEGFVIATPDDTGMWARRIQDLAAPELRAKMAENARKLRDRVSMRRHVAELDALFAEVAERRPCKSSG